MPWSKKQRDEIEYLAGVMSNGKMIGATWVQIAGRLVETDLPGMGWTPPADDVEPRSTRQSLPIALQDRILEARTDAPLDHEDTAAVYDLVRDLKQFLSEAKQADAEDSAPKTAGSGALLPGSGATPTREGETRG